MCRLFGMIAADGPVQATFWLLDAPDSLAAQSHRNADGTGVGYFDADGTPHIDKQPLAAYEDRRFATEARDLRSRTFVSHIRMATNGSVSSLNTHPFEFDGRLFAHNGVIDDVAELERHLGADLAMVKGDTDSERYFALITREIDRHDGDVGAGIRAAVSWILAHLATRSINFVLITSTELWALRCPDVHTLFVLERAPGGHDPASPGPLEQSSSHGTRVHSEHATRHPVVVVASERMDDDPGWRELASGELLHIDGSLTVHRERLLEETPPAR